MTPPTADELAGLARLLVDQARSQGIPLTGPDGLLARLSNTILENGRDAETGEDPGC